MNKRAFTLIELLVVIAIIAILAAILFPVFAQAKDAAKTTVALSNLKQTDLAMLMYSNDFDDALPLSWDSDDPSGTGLWTWQGKIYPYTKNWGVVLNPKIQPPTGNQAYWQRLLHMGSLPSQAAVPGITASPNGGYAYTGYFSNNIPAHLDGLLGFGQQGYGYGSSSVLSYPSMTTTTVSDAVDQAMITPASSWDYWMGVYGGALAQPFSNCGGWNPGSYDVVPNDWGFTGPVSIKPNTQSGIGSGCYYPDGMGVYAAVDGHAKTLDYKGQLMKIVQAPDGTFVFAHFWPAGIGN